VLIVVLLAPKEWALWSMILQPEGRESVGGKNSALPSGRPRDAHKGRQPEAQEEEKEAGALGCGATSPVSGGYHSAIHFVGRFYLVVGGGVKGGA